MCIRDRYGEAPATRAPRCASRAPPPAALPSAQRCARHQSDPQRSAVEPQPVQHAGPRAHAPQHHGLIPAELAEPHSCGPPWPSPPQPSRAPTT
eukprot:6365302-Prymnesium_polylepis.1